MTEIHPSARDESIYSAAVKSAWDAILKAGTFLGRIQAAVLLTLAFVLVLWPLGLLVRLQDPLRRRRDLPGWIPRPPATPDLKRFGHPF